MRSRRGFALLAALWLVVALATAALWLSLEARERRMVALAASERATGRAAAAAGFAIARARLGRALRQVPGVEGNSEILRASDPWLDADSLFSDTVWVGNVMVHIHVEDLGTKLDLTKLTAYNLREFLGFVLRDYETADALAQAITDWTDRDDFPHPRGAERKDYLRQSRLDLPPNRRVRTVEELRSVEGMTPALFKRIAPYLTTRVSRININAAPEAVLRAIPGLTDFGITQVLAARSQHQRIRTYSDLVPPAVRDPFSNDIGGQNIEWLATLYTASLQVTVTASAPPPARPVQMRVTLEPSGHESVVRW